MTESGNTIISILDAARIKLKRLNIALSAGALVACLGAALILMAPVLKWGGFEGTWGVVIAVIKIAAIAGVILSIARWLAFGVFLAPDRHRTALNIERSVSGVNNDLVVSLELLEDDTGTRNLYSPALADAHINAAAVRLNNIDYSSALPYRATKRVMASAGAIILAAIFMAIIWPMPTKQAAAYLFSAHLMPKKSDGLKPAEQPLTLGDFEIRYEYPAYTGWEPKTVSGADGSLRAIKGSIATIRARSLPAIKSARFEMENSALPATLSGSRDIEGKITVIQPGRYRIVAEGDDGDKFVESSAHAIEVLPDTSPQIDIVTPTADQEVEEAGVLTIKFAAKDDFAVKEVAVVYSLAGKQGRVSVVTPDQTQTEVSGTYTWDLSKLNLQPGDEVRYYLEAVDNDAVSGPKKGVSKTLKLSIFSPRKEHNRLVDLQWQLLDHMVAVLGNTLVRKPLPAGNIAPEALGPDKIIAEGLDDLIRRIEEITAGLEKDKLADMNTFTLLNNIKFDLKTLHAARKEALSPAKPSESALAKRQATETPILETDVIALDNELERQKVSEVMRRGEDLLTAQRNVADLLEKAKAGDKNAMAALEKEIAHMQDMMQALMEALSRSKGNLPDDFMNVDALKNMPTAESMNQFDKMREAIENGDLDAAMKMAEELQNNFAKMMSAMESGAQSFGQSRGGEAMQKVSEISQKTSELKMRQQQLFDESQKIGVHAQEALLAQQQAQRKAALDKLKQKIKEWRDVATKAEETARKLDPVDPRGVDGRYISLFTNITNLLHYVVTYRIPRAEQLLTAEDLYGLYGLMQSALQEAQQLQRDSQAITTLAVKDKKSADSVSNGVDRMVKIIEEIIKLLDDLLKPPDRKFSPEELKRLQEMANEQQQLKKDSDTLEQMIKDFRKKYPMIGADQEKKIGEASQQMGQAGQKLGAVDPNGALPPEAEALRKLSEMEDAMKQLQQRMKAGAMGMPMPMPMPGGSGSGSGGNEDGYQAPGQFSPGKIEIPGREGYKVPEQYRGDILRAMQNHAPEQYRNLNRDYYKKLVE